MTPAFAFRIVNVFTLPGDRLSGNPLCVFEDGRDVTDAQMQALARQMNLSETTFILPATRPEATARVRIFTPGYEMPFAGHPTLGTAHVVRALRGDAGDTDRVALEMVAGVVPVAARGDEWTLTAARAPAVRPGAPAADIAAMLGLPDAAIAGDPLWVDTGVEQLVIPIRSAGEVRAAQPDPAAMIRVAHRGRGEGMAYLWAREAPDADRLVVRFFFTQHGAVIEDPATGSACANLGGWWIATGSRLPVAFELRQGDAVARPSRLRLAVDADRGIHVTGAVLELGRGTVTL